MNAILVILLFALGLVLYFGVDLLIAFAFQWILEQVLGHPVPLFPVFVGVFILGLFFNPIKIKVKT